jgi:hypothetical protein
VLPAAASTSVPPGYSVPSGSNAEIIDSAAPSLIDPHGYWPSTFGEQPARAAVEAGDLDQRRVADQTQHAVGDRRGQVGGVVGL